MISEADLEALFTPLRAVDLYYEIVLPSTEWPTRNYSIKALAQHLGLTWRDIHPSGAASIEMYDQWVRAGAQVDLERILQYNEDDCRATRVVLDGVRALTATRLRALPGDISFRH